MFKNRHLLDRIDDFTFVRAIRRGLTATIPLLMIGSFALILNILPIAAYQAFLDGPVGSWFSALFTLVNQVTFGIFSLSIVVSVSACYLQEKGSGTAQVICGMFTCLSVYVVFIGLFAEGFNVSSFGAQGMFTALFSALWGSSFYHFLTRRDWFQVKLYTIGADNDFNRIVSVIVPSAVVIVMGYLLNWLISLLFGVSSFEQMFHQLLSGVFGLIANDSLKALLFIFLTNFLWFFGIHGSNALDTVARTIFFTEVAEASSQLENQNLVFFLNKQVIDTFVFMGGCGTTISLLVAILLFSKKKNSRKLAGMAAIPMWFNINELVVFGVPIVFNAAFFIPFLLVPLVCVGIAAVALGLGLVPAPDNPVNWAIPIFVNGFQATGSIAGSLLQLVNIGVGAVIYRWFLLRYEKNTDRRTNENMNALIDLMKRHEGTGERLTLLDLRGSAGEITKMLASDLEYTLKTESPFQLYYQPQYNDKNVCVGAEALLRWKHPICGMIYPPLLIGLAVETGLLGQVERRVFETAAEDLRRMNGEGIYPGKISVNATAATLSDPDFIGFLRDLYSRYPEISGAFCIELTEQMSFMLTDAMRKHMEEILEMNITFAVDDFSMGQTSIKYLQSSLFDIVKLDGSLIKDMVSNERSQEIIWSIINMAQTMDFKVLAEFVETAEQRDMLREMGCYLYQGYLYSPAIPREDLVSRIQEEGNRQPQAALSERRS